MYINVLYFKSKYSVDMRLVNKYVGGRSMYIINKISANNVIDFAAEELKKYLRMMMPEGCNVDIRYSPESDDGFRLGLMQDFGLDVSDAEDIELDDILYIDCDEKGGIIAGDNPRSVLLAVYEYLKQNGCRWLLPGVDGEYIPVKNIKPVKLRFKPSCRYRGWCSEGAQFHRGVLDAIDLCPKLGMNVYMIQFHNPNLFYKQYYNHAKNVENYEPEPISDEQAIQWKRECEAEFDKRGLQFHDIGHGWNYLPFGIDNSQGITPEHPDPGLTDEQISYLALINGKRSFFGKKDTFFPANTNFCMSNEKARSIVADYIVDFSAKHSNIDYLHVWLADGSNNHCECENCQKKTPSDWYVILLNEIDEKLEKAGLDTRIVFISYVDTTWAPVEERIKNPKRFTLLFAPIFRSYAMSLPDVRPTSAVKPYVRNKNKFPDTLSASLDYLDEWKKVWKGSNVAFEYHFWRHQCYDLSDLMQAKVLSRDVKAYKANGVDGIIACGTQRCFFPTGLPFYTMARTLFDTSLSYEQIEEEYLSALYGDDWKKFRDYLMRIFEALPFEFFSRDVARTKQNVHFDPARAEIIASIRDITKEGRELIASHRSAGARVRTEGLKLLAFHADVCDLISDWMSAKARGEMELAWELYDKARIEVGSREHFFENYYDHAIYFTEYYHTQNQKSPSKEDIVSIN